MSQLRYWVWLASVDGVRTISLCRVLEHFGGAMEAYFAPEERLSELEDLSPQERRAVGLTPAAVKASAASVRDRFIIGRQEDTRCQGAAKLITTSDAR